MLYRQSCGHLRRRNLRARWGGAPRGPHPEGITWEAKVVSREGASGGNGGPDLCRLSSGEKMPKVKRSRKAPPDGWELIEPTLDELDQKMREAETEPHEGKRKVESLWPIFRIHHQKTRYIFDLFYKRKAISRELYEYCIKEGYADKNLIAKWKKQGYENLCCLRCIQTRDTNFGTNCICRVPKSKLEVEQGCTLNLHKLSPHRGVTAASTAAVSVFTREPSFPHSALSRRVSEEGPVGRPDHRVHTLRLPGLLRLRPAGPDPLSALDPGLRRFLPVNATLSWEQLFLRAAPQAR
ncbi:protein BUD31 homolog isoform X2 [Hippopotamus amphibius kiboko]|uniref:protein BUD31 homolog isoform X2 n=1 Tax=Hippopotamus amphibius kiboko TaxID=575201 RepID=UPI002596F2A6|nr:protein BUD31 homolog isoform X2 [Hippopotamus amphibius kiboko]